MYISFALDALVKDRQGPHLQELRDDAMKYEATCNGSAYLQGQLWFEASIAH